MKKFFILSIICSLCLASCATSNSQKDKDLVALKELGTLYLDNGEYEMALDAFDKALAIDAENNEILYNKVLVLLARYEFDKAIALSDSSFEAFPSQLRFLKAKASALLKMKNTEEAFQVYQQILSLDPGDYAFHALVMQFALDRGYKEFARSEAMFLLNRQEETDKAISTLAILDGEGSTYALIEDYLSAVTEV
jgi:tetratricopeptide (TPR) repeat protein